MSPLDGNAEAKELHAAPTGSLAKSLNRLSLFVLYRKGLIQQTAWVALPYVAAQMIRFVSNVVLAWLLAPELLGIMLLINTLRTGGELLTDVGVGQSIVNNARGREASFYNTAWTIQIARGFLLFGLALALTIPMAQIYGNDLTVLLPAVAPVFLLTGFTSPARFLLQKDMQVRKLAIFDLSMAFVATVCQIALSWAFPTIWSLIGGLLIGTAISTFASYALMDWRTLRFCWDAESVRDILHFGKWIFVASLVYFLSMNFDRLYFAEAIPIALLGIYGIARTISDVVLQLFARLGQLLIFPKLSGLEIEIHSLRVQVLPLRRILLLSVAVALAAAAALADPFISLVYDERYQSAGLVLSVLLVGTWFGILATMSDAILMGMGKPSHVAFAHSLKLAVLAGGLPLAMGQFGWGGALLVVIFAEMARYMMLVWGKRRQGLGFARQDIAFSIVFVLLLLAFRELTMLAGLTGGISSWQAQMGFPDVR